MELGKKIKQLRMNKGLTQEALAKSLGVSYQAVSRWENEITMPDISLLPDISVFFGISIDELFEFTDESQYKRIENMLLEKKELSDLEFENARSFLEKHKGVTSIRLLALLYEHRAKSAMSIAMDYAKKAIVQGDSSKSMNNILRDGNGVSHTDWNFRNHHELIDFYYQHLNNNPNDTLIYHYLIPTLIEDNRIDEAKNAINQIRFCEQENRILNFEIMILRKEGHFEKANELLEDLKKQYGNQWYSWSVIADYLAEDRRYDEAVDSYEKAFELMEQPRYTDFLESIAHIYEINGSYKKAIVAYERIIDLLEKDWNVTFGKTYNFYLSKIEGLKTKKE